MRTARILVAVLVAVAVAACGGSSSSSTTATHSSTASSGGSSSGAPSSTVTAGPVRGKLVGANHSPKVNVNWPYSVTVTDASGHPLDGTVTIEFTFGGQVVGRDTPPTHPLKNGRWHDNLKFPAQSLGQPISVQAVVHTRQGSITLSWPVTSVK